MPMAAYCLYKCIQNSPFQYCALNLSPISNLNLGSSSFEPKM